MNYLLITPNMFGYYKDMMAYLESKGHTCKQYLDYVKLGILEKIKCKISKHKKIRSFEKYWDNIIKENKNERFDKIVLIFGDRYIYDRHIKKLKETHPESELIYYNWDSVFKYPNVLTYYKLFDKYYSFDKEDCNKYGFAFRPLYYSNKFIEKDPEFDCCISTSFSAEKVKEYDLVNSLLPNNLKRAKFLYLHSKSSYYFNKLKNRKLFKNYKLSDFSFKGMTREENNEFVANAKVVIDIPRIGQNGLTIRTFEVLHLKRKLITTNKNIRGYDFYNPQNIFVVDENTKEIPMSFFETQFDDNYQLGDYYSFEKFMEEIFEAS